MNNYCKRWWCLEDGDESYYQNTFGRLSSSPCLFPYGTYFCHLQNDVDNQDQALTIFLFRKLPPLPLAVLVLQLSLMWQLFFGTFYILLLDMVYFMFSQHVTLLSVSASYTGSVWNIFIFLMLATEFDKWIVSSLMVFIHQFITSDHFALSFECAFSTACGIQVIPSLYIFLFSFLINMKL
jgi:hypothetical protein